MSSLLRFVEYLEKAVVATNKRQFSGVSAALLWGSSNKGLKRSLLCLRCSSLPLFDYFMVYCDSFLNLTANQLLFMHWQFHFGIHGALLGPLDENLNLSILS